MVWIGHKSGESHLWQVADVGVQGMGFLVVPKDENSDGVEPMNDVEIIAELVNETDDAWLIQVPDAPQTVWIPKSKCEYDGKSTFAVPEWLAEKKDLL